MATYFVDFAKADDTGDGLSWTNAKKTLQGGLTSATASGDVVVVKYNESQILAANTTFTIYNNIKIIAASADDTGTAYTPAIQGEAYYIGHTSGESGIYVSGGYTVYVYGITFMTAGTGTKELSLCYSDNQHMEYESCTFILASTDGSSSIYGNRQSGTTMQSYCRLRNCNFKFSASGQKIVSYNCYIEWIGGKILNTGVRTTALFRAGVNGVTFIAEYVDLSYMSNGAELFTEIDANANPTTVQINKSKLPRSFVMLGAGAKTPSNKASGSIQLSNCYSEILQNIYGYADALGEAISSTDYSARDSTNPSLKITTSAYCSYTTPFILPGILFKNESSIPKNVYISVEGISTTVRPKTHQVWINAYFVENYNTEVISYTGKLSLNDWLLSKYTEVPIGTNECNWVSYIPGTFTTFKLNTNNPVNLAINTNVEVKICVGEPNATYYIDPVVRI